MKSVLVASLVLLVACKAGHHATSAGQAAKIGETVTFDDSEWVVLEVKDAGKTLAGTNPTNHEVKKTDGRFLEVHYKVTNKGKTEEMLINPPRLVDAKKDDLEHIQMESFFLPPTAKTVALDTLVPNTTRDFWTVFEVPPGATGIQCQLHALSAFGDKKNVDLGL